jgi:hypothetical protein
MALRLARTNAEAHIYMEMSPCGACGEHELVPDHGVIEVDGDLASRYTGRCPRCDAAREFVFRIPEQVIFPDEEEPVFGDERPSELLDAGQWLWLADLIARNTAAEPTEDMHPEQRRQSRIDLLTAAAAVDEALKFVPARADAVPPDALWSETGRDVYEREPGRFRRRRLGVVHQTYRDLAQRFSR